jgi:hypothetical protein
MSDAAMFVGIFGGLFVLRIIAATIFFCWIIPEGDRCVNCDAPTLRVQHVFWHRLFPKFRPSWCMACGWHGMLRSGAITPIAPQAGLPPLRERKPVAPEP